MNPKISDIDSSQIKRISQIDFLRNLPIDEVIQIIPYLKLKIFEPHSLIIKQGELGKSIFFVESGSIELTNENNGEKSVLNNSGIIGEISIITGEPRTATLNSLTKVVAWEIEKDSFLNLLNQTPKLKKSLNELIYQRTQNIVSTKTPSAKAWAGQLLRAIEIRRKGLHPWQIAMLIGFLGWLILFFNEHFALINLSFNELFIASLKLVFGFLILQGSCEALISGAERVGSRLKWDGFISGTMGSILSTLPEFVVVWFLVKVDPLMAIITSIVTIFNNSLAYSFYAFFLPKDKSGTFEMPKSLTIAGGEILIAGSATALIVGLVLLVMYITKVKSQLIGVDLLVVGGTLSAIYIFYILTLVKYYQEGSDNPNSLPPAPHNLGYNSKTSAIISLFLLGIIGSYCGGEAVGSFAETALSNTNMGKVTTSAILAFFAGISEYIIVYKSHKRGEMGIALSNVFGGMTQVMFLLLPFGLIIIGLFGIIGMTGQYFLPISPVILILFLLLFPLFYTLHQYLEQNNRISNLGAAGMSGIYILLLYFLFTLPI